jgi:pentatricopeptide repeat protein
MGRLRRLPDVLVDLRRGRVGSVVVRALEPLLRRVRPSALGRVETDEEILVREVQARETREALRRVRTESARNEALERARRREEERERKRKDPEGRAPLLDGILDRLRDLGSVPEEILPAVADLQVLPEGIQTEFAEALVEATASTPGPPEWGHASPETLLPSTSTDEEGAPAYPEVTAWTPPWTDRGTSADQAAWDLDRQAALAFDRAGRPVFPPLPNEYGLVASDGPDGRTEESLLGADTERGFWARRRWLIGSVASAFLGLGVFLAVRFLGPSAVTDVNLEEEASEAARGGDVALAAERYRELAERSTDTKAKAAWMLERAAALERGEDIEGALAVLSELLATSIEDEDVRYRAQLKYATLFMLSKRPLDALPVYEDLVNDLSIPPEHLATALIGLGDAHAALGFQRRGAEVQRLALSRFPANPEVALAVARRMAEALLAKDRAEEALAILEGVRGDNLEATERAIWLMSKGQVLDLLGRSDEALSLYDGALALLERGGPLATNTRYRIARLRYARGDLRAANDLLMEIDDPRAAPELRSRSLLLRAEILRRKGDYEDAALLCRRVLDEWPEDEDAVEEARAGLGALALATGGLEAIASLEAELQKQGAEKESAADILLGHASWTLERGDPESALAIYDKIASSFDPRTRWGLAGLQGRADALFNLGRTNEGIEVLRLVRTQVSGQERLRVDGRLGDALLKAGQVDEAELAFRSLLQVSGGAGELGWRAALGIAQVAEARGQIEAAIAQYSKVLEGCDDAGIQASALQALAGLFLESGQEDKSLGAWRRFMDLNTPGSPALGSARMAMAELYAKRGDRDREKALLEEVLAQDPGPLSQARARLRLAELKLEDGSIEAALADFEALAVAPMLSSDLAIDVTLGRGAALVALGRHDEALQVVRAVQKDPSTNWDEAALLGLERQALLGLGREQEADAIFARISPGQGDGILAVIESEIEKAVRFREAGRPEEAMEVYRKVLPLVEDRPAQGAILRDMALLMAGTGDRDGARGTLDRLGAEYGDIGEARFMAAFTLAELDLQDGDAEKALGRLQGVEAPDEGHRLWHLQAVARAHETLGDIEAARKTWREILDTWPRDPTAMATAWTGLGDLLTREGEPRKAIAAYQRAAALAPAGSLGDQARLRVASAFAEAGDPDQAMELLDEMRREEKTLDPEVWVQLQLLRSAVLQEKEDWEGALKAADSVAGRALGADWAAQVTETRGVCLVGLGRHGDAELAYQRLEDKFPASNEARTTARMGLASVALARGDIDAAVERFNEVLRVSNDRFRQAEALLRMGQALDAVTREDEARRAWRRLVKEYPEQRELLLAARAALEE